MPASRLIQASDLRKYDSLAFDSTDKTVQLWRIEGGRKKRLASKPCPEIPSREYFLSVVQTFGSGASPALTNTIEDNSFPSGVWAYQYI